MIRQAAAVVIVLLLSPSWVTAQGTELTVNVVVGECAQVAEHRQPRDWSCGSRRPASR